jgi:hypothetical protein
MRFTIINPSDDYTIDCATLEIAAVACLTIGRGKYAFKQDGGSIEIPTFLFGGYQDWFMKTFKESVDDVFERVMKEPLKLADAFDSVLIKGCKTKEDSDKKRSSLNDIGQYAWDMASTIRRKVREDEINKIARIS